MQEKLQALERHLWKAAHIITGPIDAADYKRYIFPILFFKRICDVYDEEYSVAKDKYADDLVAREPEYHRIAIPEKCHWRDVMAARRNIGDKLQKAFKAIESADARLRGIFGHVQWDNTARLPDALLRKLLTHFDKIHLGIRDVRDDDMGRAYEYLIKRFADKSKAKAGAGEFYTPREVVRLMVNFLRPQAGESVYDPACGTGGMLLETMHYVREKNGDARLVRLFGQENNASTESIARMNLLLHGLEDFKIMHGDTLRAPHFAEGGKLRQFDCVIANPPFSLEEWGHEEWQEDKFGRHVYGMVPKNYGDFAWVMHMLMSLKESTGRMAVVLSPSCLSRGRDEAVIRQRLVQEGHVRAVVGLAGNLFYGTSFPTVILVLERCRAPRASTLFVDARSIFTKGRAKNHLSEAQTNAIIGIFAAQRRKRQNVAGVCRWAAPAEIRANNYDLSLSRYVWQPVARETMRMAEAAQDLRAAQNALDAAEAELDLLLQREGW